MRLSPSQTLQRLDLDAFARRLLSVRRAYKRGGPAPERQLLYYGVMDSVNPPALLAVVGHPSSGRSSWLQAELSEQTWRSLADTWPALLWPEMEVHDRTGRVPEGHPDLHPLLKPHMHTLSGRASGAGVFSLPLGPVRADVTESGYFLFDTIGEQIMHLQPQLFYKHRGIERMAVGRTVEDVTLLAERISGTTTAGHTAAYVTAVEQASGYATPDAVRWERQLFMELERLYNHAHDISQMASASGMTVGQAQVARVKEECLRLAGDLTGCRYLRGAIKPFGSAAIDWRAVSSIVLDRLAAADARMQRFVSLLQRTPTFVDRLVGTGIVNRDWADDYGLVGPTARACGIRTDARLEYAPWTSDVGFTLCVVPRANGDALDRFEVRVQEWSVSIQMIRSLLSRLASTNHAENSDGPHGSPGPTVSKGWGGGTVEGPRGRISHVVQVDHGRIAFWGIRSASSWIWPVFGLATANGNIQTDFPVIDASFGLSYAGLDR